MSFLDSFTWCKNHSGWVSGAILVSVRRGDGFPTLPIIQFDYLLKQIRSEKLFQLLSNTSVNTVVL